MYELSEMESKRFLDEIRENEQRDATEKEIELAKNVEKFLTSFDVFKPSERERLKAMVLRCVRGKKRYISDIAKQIDLPPRVVVSAVDELISEGLLTENKEDISNTHMFELIELVKKISERDYCAGWVENIEFDLWDAIEKMEDGEKSERFDRCELEKLAELSDDCGYWVGYSGKYGEIFIQINNWLENFKIWKSARLSGKK